MIVPKIHITHLQHVNTMTIFTYTPTMTTTSKPPWGQQRNQETKDLKMHTNFRYGEI